MVNTEQIFCYFQLKGILQPDPQQWAAQLYFYIRMAETTLQQYYGFDENTKACNHMSTRFMGTVQDITISINFT